MKKLSIIGFLLCGFFLMSMMINPPAYAAAQEVQALKNGEIHYYDSLHAAFLEEWNEGTSYEKKVQDFHSKKWIPVETATLVKLSDSKMIYFAKEKEANRYIQKHQKTKVPLQSVKNKAKVAYKKQAPEIQLTLDTTQPTNQAITITSTIKSKHNLAVKKWAAGKKAAHQFSMKDTTIQEDAFTVTANGLYTVYALDKKGNKATKTIEITNIDQVKPTISLTPHTTDLTNQNVTIKASVKDNGALITKWAMGNQTADYFTVNGEVLTGDMFSVNQNGVYTVYAKDAAGNEQLQTIEITNIDKSLPVIHLSVPEDGITEVSKKIQVDVSDESGIKDRKWAFGEKTVAYFADKGSRMAPLQNANQKDKIIALKNGVYTVYAEDQLGNKTVETITLDGIQPFSEVTQEGVQCEVCRMDLFKTDPHKVYSAKAIDEEGYTHFFCRTGCMYHQQNANNKAFDERYIRNYGAAQPRLNNWISSDNAITVKYKSDETAKGLMGWKLFHFATVSEAANYLGVQNEQVVVEPIEKIIEYTKTNNKGMNYQYTVDQRN